MATYPKSIKHGDKVGIVTPSTAIPVDRLDQVIGYIKQIGLVPVVGESTKRAAGNHTALLCNDETIIQNRKNELTTDEQINFDHYDVSYYDADSPQARANDINRFFADPSIAAIWCQRGGYSSARVMPYLDYDLIRQNPKIILGYSDITNIVMGIYNNANIITYYAPMVTPNFVKPDMLNNGKPDAYTLDYFNRFIFHNWQTIQLVNPPNQPFQIMAGGSAIGTLVGGNLQELAWACSTDYGIKPTGEPQILFLEDVDMSICDLDMCLTQLMNSGSLRDVTGIILGDFLNPINRTDGGIFNRFTVDEMFKLRLSSLGLPVMAHIKLGHDKQTATIPIGAHCKLDATNRTIAISRAL